MVDVSDNRKISNVAEVRHRHSGSSMKGIGLG